MERMVYSLGTREFCNAKRPGSTEVTFDVSCENETKLIAQKTKANDRDRYRCMFMDWSIKQLQMQFAKQIKGKFQTVLLNAFAEKAIAGSSAKQFPRPEGGEQKYGWVHCYWLFTVVSLFICSLVFPNLLSLFW